MRELKEVECVQALESSKGTLLVIKSIVFRKIDYDLVVLGIQVDINKKMVQKVKSCGLVLLRLYDLSATRK